MRKDQWINMLRLMPPEQQNQLVLVLANGIELSVDMFVRFEPDYLVMRGRVQGTSDEGRAFFIPYDQMCYLRLERVVKAEEIQLFFGEAVALPEGRPAGEEDGAEAKPPPPTPDAVRKKLLERIRAKQTGGSPPPPPPKP
ncbi:MAG TPA: hypothetical protein VIL46_18240 [Gemmataceae bacterium]